jgi:hypothetical protein
MTRQVVHFVENHGWIDGLLQGLFKFPNHQRSSLGADLHPDLLGDEMKEWPIIFNGEMVKAILEDRKTMTRRMPKHLYEIGDHLWVRENLICIRDSEFGFNVHFVADNEYCEHWQVPHLLRDGREQWFMDYKNWWDIGKLKQIIPSIHMPRWASRITLEVTNISRMQNAKEWMLIVRSTK